MKIIAIFFLAITVAFSQNVEPTQRQFDYKDINGNDVNNGYFDGSLDYFKINNFTLGFHWGGQRKISHALLASQSDIGTGWGIDLNGYYNENTNLFVRASWADNYKDNNGVYHEFWLYTHCKYDDQIMFTKSLCYSAALAHDPADDYNLIKLTSRTDILPDDPNNHIFGFKNKDARCTVYKSILDDNKWRLKVEDNVPANTVILRDPWPNNLLSYTEETNQTINENFSGRAYYVSINLRRLYDEDGFEDVDVLKIEVPYTYLDNSTGTALFRQIPSDQYNDCENPNGYGLMWNLTDPLEDEPQIIVKEYMLPSTTQDNGDITISGYIEFDGISTPFLKPHDLNTGVGQIDKLNLKVTYMGNCRVAINWIKFETPNTRKLLNGYYDNLIKDGIQDDMTKLTTPGFTDRDIRPARFIINVEGSPINWAAERHFSKLVGNIITGQSAAELPSHYDYYINPVDKWYSFAKMVPSVSNPFCKPNSLFATDLWKTMGLAQGYGYRQYYTTVTTDMFTSAWEWLLRYDQTKNLGELVDDLKDDNDVYTNSGKVLYFGGPISTQAYWEWNLHNNYVNKYKAGFQYSDIPWFPQTFVEGFIYPAPVAPADGGGTSYCPSHPDGTRVITGEEFRLMNWNPIIMGAKGLMYDGDTDNPAFLDIKLNPSTKIMMTRFGLDTLKTEDWESFLDEENISDMEYLSSEHSTSDFLDMSYDHFKFIENVYSTHTVALTMGVPDNRIFMGKKSVRLEMRKLHNWVRHNEETLMNLQLLSWYGKGYTVLYNQRRTFDTDSLIKKFINPSKTITKKLYGLSELGYTNESVTLDPEESFFDMTLLCNKNDTMMNNSCFIGIQNRWTDPFIYFDKDEEDMHWVHITTAEFDELTNNPNGAKNPLRPNGDTYSASDWQGYYWKRLGCREITIPFNYCDPNKPDEYVLLHVQELRDSTAINLNWPWWRQEKFNNSIDTIIGQNSSLAVKYLPGEGKLFKIDT